MRNMVTEDDAYLTLEGAYAWHYGEAIRLEEYGTPDESDQGLIDYHHRAKDRMRRCMEIINPVDAADDISHIEKQESMQVFVDVRDAQSVLYRLSNEN